jgi:hypothetical protein
MVLIALLASQRYMPIDQGTVTSPRVRIFMRRDDLAARAHRRGAERAVL